MKTKLFLLKENYFMKDKEIKYNEILDSIFGKKLEITHWNVEENTTQKEIEDLSKHEGLSISCSKIPDWIVSLKKVRDLTFSGDYITIPDSIGNLKQIEKLVFRSNNLELVPDSVGNISSLKDLSIESTNTKISDNIGNLLNLETLRLKIDKINSLPENIGKLSKLRMLTVDCNHLEIIPEIISELSSLEVLHIDTMKELPLPEKLCRLPNLEYLSIRGNVPEDIGLLKSLQWLHVYYKNRKAKDKNARKIPISITSLINLKNLYIDTDIIPEGIGDLLSLQELEVNFENKFPKIPLSINNLQELKVFKIVKKYSIQNYDSC